MAALFEEADAAGRAELDQLSDDVSYDLLDALAAEKDPRATRMVELMRESRRTASHTSRRACGSRPVVGSSRKTSGGSPTRLMAMSSRRRMPPE